MDYLKVSAFYITESFFECPKCHKTSSNKRYDKRSAEELEKLGYEAVYDPITKENIYQGKIAIECRPYCGYVDEVPF
jgi:hypothetical protein